MLKSQSTLYFVLIFYNCNNSPGEAATEGGKELRQQAGEIMACEYIVFYQILICAYLVIIIDKLFSLDSHTKMHNNYQLQQHQCSNNNIRHEGKQL